MFERILQAITIAALAPSIALSAACAEADGAEFFLEGFQRNEDCLSQASPVQSEKASLREHLDTVSLYFQTDFRLPSLSDGVFIHVYQPNEVRERLGEPIELADPLELVQDDEEFDEPPVVRAQLLVDDTCPQLKERFGLRGTVVFEELGSESGEPVIGYIEEAEAVSLRREDVVVEEVSGNWDYVVRERRPYRHFPDFPMEEPPGPAP